MVVWPELNLVGLKRPFPFCPWEIWHGWTMALMWQLLWTDRRLRAHQLFVANFVCSFVMKGFCVRVLPNKSPCQTHSHPRHESIPPWSYLSTWCSLGDPSDINFLRLSIIFAKLFMTSSRHSQWLPRFHEFSQHIKREDDRDVWPYRAILWDQGSLHIKQIVTFLWPGKEIFRFWLRAFSKTYCFDCTLSYLFLFHSITRHARAGLWCILGYIPRIVHTTRALLCFLCFRIALQWRHNGHDGVSNHQPCQCLLTRLFRYRSKKTSKLRVTGLGAGNSPVTDEFPAQMPSNAENVSIWWRHHGLIVTTYFSVTLLAPELTIGPVTEK